MLIHDKQKIKVSKVLCTCMLVERKHSSSESVFELHYSIVSLLVNGASTSQDGMGCTFDWLKICAFTVVLFTQNLLGDTKIWVPSCSKFCANRGKILIGPVWINCLVKFLSWLKIHQVPCEGGLRITLIWHDIRQSYISPEFPWKMLKYTCYREYSAWQH